MDTSNYGLLHDQPPDQTREMMHVTRFLAASGPQGAVAEINLSQQGWLNVQEPGEREILWSYYPAPWRTI
jgi:hypothetical protein